MNERRLNIPKFDLQPAIARLRSVLDTEGLLTATADLAGFRDPFQHPAWRDFEPGAVLLPTSTEQVQDIVRIANACKVPLWTSSQGRNNGYGGAAPRVCGSLVLSLRRMNRVLEVDEANAAALIEPGVSFFDLYNHLRASGSKLWMSVPDLGWGSVVGNTLDHGVGYTPNGDHVGQQCGMEVVLANGQLLRTGMGAMNNARATLVHKRNCGPSADGLFMQSNFGIVTKMGLWLMQPPECYMPGWLQLRKDSDL